MELPMTGYAFRPRFRALAMSSVVLGASLLVFGLLGESSSTTFALVTGALGATLGTLYLLSPAWKLRVEVGDDELRVVRGQELRMALPWFEVKRVVVDGDACFVDGGHPERSLLVPGRTMRASYRIARHSKLVDEILLHVPESVIERPDAGETDRTEP